MRASLFFFVAVAFLSSCGSGGSGNDASVADLSAAPRDLAVTPADLSTGGGDGGGQADGGKCEGAPNGACGTCLKNNCNAEMTACLGANWETAESPNSVCAGLYACICDCQNRDAGTGSDAGNNDCPGTCAAQIGNACVTCFATAWTCVAGKCGNDCK